MVVPWWLLAIFIALWPSSSFAADLSGRWQTESGAVYNVAHVSSRVSATYELPNDDQIDTGIKAGDIAFVGEVIDNFIVATFYQRFSIAKIPSCAANPLSVSTIYIEVREKNKMEGDLLRRHVNDDCQVDKYVLQHLVFIRK